MKTGRLFALIAALVAFPLAAQAPGSFQQRLLDAHNQERARIGVKPLVWSPVLAAQARVWADDLARRLKTSGEEAVLLLAPGFEAWAARGHPVESGDGGLLGGETGEEDW